MVADLFVHIATEPYEIAFLLTCTAVHLTTVHCAATPRTKHSAGAHVQT